MTAAAANSLQSCLTLCDPINGNQAPLSMTDILFNSTIIK